MKTKINEKGYVVFDDENQKLVHRWVAGKKYGKGAIIEKQIHHIDGDKTNNDKTNLLLIDKEDHYQLTKHENKNKLLLKVIIFLAVYYTLISWLLYFPIPEINRAIFLTTMRVSVLIILFIALEIRFGLIAQMIRSPKRKYLNIDQ